MNFTCEYESALCNYAQKIHEISNDQDIFLTFGSSIIRMLCDLQKVDCTLQPLFQDKLFSIQYQQNEKPYLSTEQFWSFLENKHENRLVCSHTPLIIEDVMLMGRKMYELLTFFEKKDVSARGLVLASHYHQSRPGLDIVLPQAPEFAGQLLRHLS